MTQTTSRRSSAKLKAVVFGALSIGLYATTFMFSDTVLHYCAKGGFYNVLPVSTVFLFSYIHGSFASNVWTALGIEASHSAGKKAVKESGTRPTQAPRQRAVAAN